MNLRHIRLIAAAAIPSSLRGGTGIVYAMLTITVGLTLSNMILDGVANFGIDKVLTYIEKGLNTFLFMITLEGTVGDATDPAQLERMRGLQEWGAYLLQQKPALLSAIFVLQLILVPLFVAAGSFNQLAGDLQHGAVRYQLLRTSRLSLFLGRFLGSAIFTALLMTILSACVVIYMGLKLDLYEWGPLIAWGVRGLLILVVASLPYVAFCSWISASVNSPFTSLVLTNLTIPAHPFVALLAMSAWEPLGKLIFLMPWGIQHWLFHPDPWIVLATAAGCLGYTALFLFIGYRAFRKRDL